MHGGVEQIAMVLIDSEKGKERREEMGK